MFIDDIVTKLGSGSQKNRSIDELLALFGDLLSITVSEKRAMNYISEDLPEYQFAVVYKYIIDENKSDRQTFKGSLANSTNVKANDFISGLQKYIHNACYNIISDFKTDNNYSCELLDELNVIKKRSSSSLAQSLSTKINRYDNKIIITSIYDALQRGVSIRDLGKILSQHYVSSNKNDHGYAPMYRQYIDRQKAIMVAGK